MFSFAWFGTYKNYTIKFLKYSFKILKNTFVIIAVMYFLANASVTKNYI